MEALENMLQLNQILRVRCHKVSGKKKVRSSTFQERAPVFPDELDTVVDEDKGDFAELRLLFRMQQRVVQGIAQLLQDWQENPVFRAVCEKREQKVRERQQPVVEGEVAVSVAENQPTSKCCVCSCQLPLHRVLV